MELAIEEKKELEKRGFYSKELIKFQSLILSFAKIIGISIILVVITALSYVIFWGQSTNDSIFWWFFIWPAVLLFIYFLWCIGYILLWKIFYSKNGVLAFWKIFKNPKEVPFLCFILKILGIWVNQTMSNIIIYFPVLLCLATLVISAQFNPQEYILLYKAILWLLIPTLIPYVLRLFIEHFHPLYAFGNLGEKIQKLTPRIKEQSQKIQSEFQSDMNFSVLSNWFDSLSATFSEIVSLVIKFEKVEARANKWNLFDSEKYINSLRSDIVAPLLSLQQFLENQKVELLKSQKELSRVKVWGSKETGNSELQSKRSESLIRELTENIEKLDVMIGKIG